MFTTFKCHYDICVDFSSLTPGYLDWITRAEDIDPEDDDFDDDSVRGNSRVGKTNNHDIQVSDLR